MNIVDPEHGVLGCYGIVGGSIAAATGAALALRDTGSVAVAYFGDGAANQAYFFECLNFAKVFELPVVFVCENNGYGEYTPTEAVTPGGIQPRAAAMELPTDGRRRDGRVGRARDRRARSSAASARAAGPSSWRRSRTASSATRAAIPASTGPRASSSAGRSATRCVVAPARLREEYGLAADEVDAIDREVEERLAAIEQSALAAPFPQPSEGSEFAVARG